MREPALIVAVRLHRSAANRPVLSPSEVMSAGRQGGGGGLESAAGSVWGPRGTGFYLSGEAEGGSVRLSGGRLPFLGLGPS